MSEFSRWIGNVYRYLVCYTAYGGVHDEFEIRGEQCRVVSDRELTGVELAEEVALHIEEQDGIPVSQVVIHRIGRLAS